MFALKNVSVTPMAVYLYVPPIVWKGDSVGHIGGNDLFFWVLEGECFLKIDSESYIIRPGQLAFLPKGKMRTYTHISEKFSMYEMAFVAESDGKNLMEQLGLSEENYVVDIPNREEMSFLFESSCRTEMFKNPIYDMAWCANIINIIRIYTEQRNKIESSESVFFRPVTSYMNENIEKNINLNELAELVFMQPNYFITRFKKTFGLSPIAYLNRLRIYKAMSLISTSDTSIDEIAKSVGILDTSYFARVFKKHCGATPSEYRRAFRRT